jgi:hypothetical protein
MNIASQWLHQCRSLHFDCLASIIPELPTRVIDVCMNASLDGVRVFQSNGARAEYVALSHCWGGIITPLLSSDTIERFQRKLPYNDLPKNFQDAIIITRRLRIRYLWIDSLCIIQDSKQDWSQESKKMGLVYRNSSVTISALASKGSTHGILVQEPDDQPPSPQPVALAISTESADQTKLVSVERDDFHAESLSSLEFNGPLGSRGWCLQESVLSPRHLYFGRRQIYWRCPAGYCAADGTDSGLRVPENRLPNLSSVLFHDILRCPPSLSSTDSRSLFVDYYLLVENYSHRNLTFGSDKLPAFSGIVARLHTVIGGE